MVIYNQYSSRGLCLGFRHNKLRRAHRESISSGTDIRKLNPGGTYLVFQGEAFLSNS